MGCTRSTWVGWCSTNQPPVFETTVKTLERIARIYSDFANGLLSTDELILDFGASRCLLLSRDEIRLCGFLQCVNRAQAQITMPMVPNVMSTRLINSWSCI